MILVYAERYHTIPLAVEEQSFERLCESYDDILMDDERQRISRQHSTYNYKDSSGQICRHVAVGDYTHGK